MPQRNPSDRTFPEIGDCGDCLERAWPNADCHDDGVGMYGVTFPRGENLKAGPFPASRGRKFSRTNLARCNRRYSIATLPTSIIRIQA